MHVVRRLAKLTNGGSVSRHTDATGDCKPFSEFDEKFERIGD